MKFPGYKMCYVPMPTPVIRSLQSRALAKTKKIPRDAGDFQTLLQRSSKIRMIRGIGIPTSQSRMGMDFPFLVTS
jgi:hypothetical protein